MGTTGVEKGWQKCGGNFCQALPGKTLGGTESSPIRAKMAQHSPQGKALIRWFGRNVTRASSSLALFLKFPGPMFSSSLALCSQDPWPSFRKLPDTLFSSSLSLIFKTPCPYFIKLPVTIYQAPWPYFIKLPGPLFSRPARAQTAHECHV